MKIVFVQETNEASKTALGVLSEFSRQGAEVVFVSLLERGELHQALGRQDIPAHSLEIGSMRDWPSAITRLADLVRSERPAVVHGVEPVPASLAALAARRARLGLRVFHRQHSTARWPQTLFARVANRTSHHVIACSDFAGRATCEEGVPESKVTVVHNGVPEPRQVGVTEVRSLKAQLGIPDDVLVASSVARLRPEKGIQLAIEALSTSGSSAPLVYVVAGMGPYEEDLKALAERKAADVRFVGHQDDVAPWFAIADLVLMPSMFDAAPLAAAEAMACGKPIIASATGGLVEYVEDGVTGIHTPVGDVQALRSAIRGLSEEPELRLALGSAARERFHERFSVERMVRGCMATYRYALGSR